ANSVWSLPMPTLAPAWMRVPRWRTRMLPASTIWSPKRLTPRRLEWESRPLRELPPAFLCAISTSLAGDAGDLDFGVALAVTRRALGALAPAQLEDLQLLAEHVGDDLRLDLGARHDRRADLERVAFADREDLVEHDLGADLGRQLLDPQLLAGCDAILLAAGFHDR